MSASTTQQPTLLGGHAQYVKGAAEEAVGAVTGSEEWKSSGASDKAAGVDAMKAASEARDPATSGLGRAEELAGKAVGCEGMVKEGEESKKE